MTDVPNVIISTPTGDVDASKATLPETGRRFRNAWAAEGDVIDVDMDKALEISKDRIRQARTPLMEQLDVAYMRATEQGEDTAAIVTAKNALREAPQDARLTDAENDEELYAAEQAIIQEMTDAAQLPG